MSPIPAINILVPGSGLLLRDRLMLGCGLLLIWIFALGLLLVAPLLMTPDGVAQLRLLALLLWLGAGLVGGVVWWFWEADTPLADDLLRDYHGRIAQAYLQGDQAQAQALAHELVRRGRRLPVTWELLALVAASPLRERAAARAQALRQARRGI
ncbi:MAG: hypothetical protein EA402_10365 [Planctomycetota bacterium]|nr:MAG: hypothetical protein EA402_10365 [Planctomycetota bacterium]